MGNQLIETSGFQAPVVYDAKDFAEVAGGGDFLPRIQLMGSQSKLVQDEKMKKGEYALIKRKDTFVNLGDSVDALVIAWHPKALEINGEEITAIYDVKDPEFNRIKAASSTPNSGCMFGPEYLLYLPQYQEYATFHLASASARNEAPNLHSLLGGAATISSQKVSSKKFQWMVPVVTPCSTPFDVPPVEEITDKANKFLNPKKEEKVKAEPAAAGADRVR